MRFPCRIYEEEDRARIEIEFSTPEEMKRWKAPAWLKELIDKGVKEVKGAEKAE